MSAIDKVKEGLLKSGVTLVAFSPTVILARRERDAFVGREYITWAISQYGDIFWGHYDLDRTSGLQDFAKRVAEDAR
jgi:hypothetical protein